MTRITFSQEDRGCICRGSLREKNNSNSKKKRKYKEKKNFLTSFCEEFATELDIFDSTLSIPAWTFDYRDYLICKISPELRKICRKLKTLGLNFKIKWPVEIDGKWKFADVFFPR